MNKRRFVKAALAAALCFGLIPACATSAFAQPQTTIPAAYIPVVTWKSAVSM